MTVWDLIFTLQTAIDAGVLLPTAIYTDKLLWQLEDVQTKINKANELIRNPLLVHMEIIKMWQIWRQQVIVFLDEAWVLQWQLNTNTKEFAFPWEARFRMD